MVGGLSLSLFSLFFPFLLKKHEVLLDRLSDIPGTRHAGRKGDKITFSKGGWFASIGRSDRYGSRKQVGRFIFTIRPWKRPHIASPGTPIDCGMFWLFVSVIVRRSSFVVHTPVSSF